MQKKCLARYSGTPLFSLSACMQDKASALPLLEPGRYVRVNWKRVKKQSPTSLSSIQSLGRLEKLQVLMISVDHERVSCSLQLVPPFFQTTVYRQQLSIPDVIISLCRRQVLREKCYLPYQSYVQCRGNPLALALLNTSWRSVYSLGISTWLAVSGLSTKVEARFIIDRF